MTNYLQNKLENPALGLENLCSNFALELKGRRVGLLSNPASCDRNFTHATYAIDKVAKGCLKCLFSPQHGFFAEKQDNMVESGHDLHPQLKIPVYSLYGETRTPRDWMFEDIDLLLLDLWDVGCRVYTFFTTVLACLEKAGQNGVEVWVLDRPNPLGRGEEGPILPDSLASFVGPYSMPLRHGLTMGELCRLVAAEKSLDLKFKVIPVLGWKGDDFSTTGLPWILPSPNLPTFESARVYPGGVLLEGTTLSEGRGTTKPFEIFGAPLLDPWKVLVQIEEKALNGAFLRPLFFEPTFHKYAGKVCGGFQLHVTNPKAFRSVRATLAVLGAIARTHPNLWQLRKPPYEYEYERRPLDLLLGDSKAVDALFNGAYALDIEESWQTGLLEWRDRIKPHLLYP